MPTIRNAREGEADLLTEIGLRAWAQAMGPIGGSEDLRVNALDAFSYFTRYSWVTITVIEENGVAAGWAAREGLDETVTDFWIDPSFQRRGLGTTLLREIERQILDQGLDIVRLQTHAQNSDAVSFFEKNGYAINWLSISYSPKLDQDVQSVGLSRWLVAVPGGDYGREF
ncbi:GNAT family N-acetyltransferase [Rhizobium sp. SAFR-030]|uniref:GNAT family N-acetyltransferase n=1 Tax=Rhizobium sp. SAFR-030 TaxID=3387277 RepID=UPI003F7CF823